MARATLVAIEHADGVAAVYRDGRDGSLLLTLDLEDDDPEEIEGYEIALIQSERLEAVGGRAPVGAVRAEARGAAGDSRRAELGDGAWLLVMPRDGAFTPEAVLFRDAEGGIAPIPQPAGASAEPVADAAERCPACEQRSWELVTRADREPWQPERVIACCTCGHEALAYFGPRPEPPDLALAGGVSRAASVVGKLVFGALGIADRRALRRAQFPVFGLDSRWQGPRFCAGTGYDGLQLYSVDLGHGDPVGSPFVVVSTVHERSEPMSPEALASSALWEALTEMAPETRAEAPADLSDPARQLGVAFAEREREAEASRRLAGASRRAHLIPVDGEPVPFAAVESGELWAGGSRLGELHLSLVARDIRPADIGLARIFDLASYLDG